MTVPEDALDHGPDPRSPEGAAPSGNLRLIVIIAAVGVLLLVLPAALLAIYFVISVDNTQSQASVATTRLQMQILADAMQLHRLQTRTSAATLEQLIPYLDATEVPGDAWDNQFVYEVDADGAWKLTSYGSDGLPGGEDEASDLVVEGAGR